MQARLTARVTEAEASFIDKTLLEAVIKRVEDELEATVRVGRHLRAKKRC
jgi:hypothetical protein